MGVSKLKRVLSRVTDYNYSTKRVVLLRYTEFYTILHLAFGGDQVSNYKFIFLKIEF